MADVPKQTTNGELLREMIQLSNNSRMTNEAAYMLSQKLDGLEMKELIEWLRHASRQVEIEKRRNINNSRRPY
jgi:hypothetical protein